MFIESAWNAEEVLLLENDLLHVCTTLCNTLFVYMTPLPSRCHGPGSFHVIVREIVPFIVAHVCR